MEALFSLSTACLFGETSFLIPPLNMPLLYFEGGRGGLDLKAEEVSLPSWGLLYYFFSLRPDSESLYSLPRFKGGLEPLCRGLERD